MLLVDAGGWLTVTEAPTPGELARLAGSAPPNMIPGAPGPSRWSPKVARIKAHKSPIIAAASAVRDSSSGSMGPARRPHQLLLHAGAELQAHAAPPVGAWERGDGKAPLSWRPVLFCKLRQVVLFSHCLPSNMLAACLPACLVPMLVVAVNCRRSSLSQPAARRSSPGQLTNSSWRPRAMVSCSAAAAGHSLPRAAAHRQAQLLVLAVPAGQQERSCCRSGCQETVGPAGLTQTSHTRTWRLATVVQGCRRQQQLGLGPEQHSSNSSSWDASFPAHRLC